MGNLTFAACVAIAAVLLAMPSRAQEQQPQQPGEIQSVPARLVCSCRCFGMEQEMHDLELPDEGECKSFDNLDCRLTTGRNGRYTDCTEIGVPAQ